uniref:Ankyrin repeat protein n=1 Tax=viral metagenome TaxID=1070528 RepID=A0A6C0E8Z9_9ZZZZ
MYIFLIKKRNDSDISISYNTGSNVYKEYKEYTYTITKTFIKNIITNFSDLPKIFNIHSHNIPIWFRVFTSSTINKGTDVVVYNKFPIILSELYNLFDLKTIKKFNLEKYINRMYVCMICEHNKLDTLKYLHKNDLLNLNYQADPSRKYDYNLYPMDFASKGGNVNVLNWWIKSGLPIQYSENALKGASANGHVHVLEWWKNSGLKLQYSSWTLNSIAHTKNTGQINSLEWWKNSGLHLLYHSDSMDQASYNDRIDILEWWKNSGLPLKYSSFSIDQAFETGCTRTLKWWLESGLPLKMQEYSIDDFTLLKI